MYWFYRLKEIVKVPYHKDSDDFFLDTENVEQDTFVAESKDKAKEYLYERFGKLPFRKPKEAIEGDMYLYLTASEEYWYKRDHEVMNVTCDFCKETVGIVGSKNIIQDKRGIYCSEECRTNNVKKHKLEDEWIYEDDHLNISDYENRHFSGYVYRITNKKTMKSYVGQTVKPVVFRWWQHLKVEKKFEQVSLGDLVFEVLEVVTYDAEDELDKNQYQNAKDKLNKRESYNIQLFDCVDEGYNLKS